MLPLRWTERAVTNLADIADFISQNSPVYAESVVSRIDRQLQLLALNPLMGKVAVEVADLEIRELVVDSFRIFYRARAECIELIAIVHSRQQSPPDFK